MSSTKSTLQTNWAEVEAQLNAEGYALLPGFLSDDQVDDLTRALGANGAASVPLEDEGIGRGRSLRLPGAIVPWIDVLREHLYGALVPIASKWASALGESVRYPETLSEFLHRNDQAGQTQVQSYLTLLGEGDFQALHQRIDGEHVFPIQVVGLLGDPGSDFTGGEFVMTEQRPRMQSRPMVLPLRKGDLAVIASAHRPHRGTKGDYRVNLKHAISRVRSGERMGLELLLHHAIQGQSSTWSREPGR